MTGKMTTDTTTMTTPIRLGLWLLLIAVGVWHALGVVHATTLDTATLQDILAPTGGVAEMGARAIAICGTAASMVAQLVKLIARPPERAGAAIVVVISGALVALWTWDQQAPVRGHSLEIVTAWLAISTSAIGVFNLARTIDGALLNLRTPRVAAGGES